MGNCNREIICNLILYVAERPGESVLHCDDMTSYVPPIQLEEMDAVQLIEIIDRASSLLRDRIGYDATAREEKPEKIHITRDYRILLPERNNSEVKIAALPKSVFILFLKHPEGIDVCQIDRYSSELYQIYCRITNRLDADGIKDSIQRITDRRSNSFNAHKTQLSRALSRYFSDSTLGSYLISGECGSIRYIPLRRSFVIWD